LKGKKLLQKEMSYQERTPKSKMKATKKSQKQKQLKPTKRMKIIP
jgi:hypothetical protein